MPEPDLDLLADLDADLLPPERAARVRAAAQADPRSAAVLDALAVTRAQLGALGDPPVPAHLSARWAAALDSAAVDHAAIDDPAPAPVTVLPVRRHARRVLGALVAAAAVVAGVLLVRADDPLPVSRVELAAVARSTVGLDDLGELTDPDRRAGCLAAVASPGTELAGGRRVTLDGEPGVLLVLSTGVRGRFQVLVVDPGCRSVLDELVIGP